MANSLNNQGVRTPRKGGLGIRVHTFRRGLLVRFRKSPHRTEKALRHAQKPATPRSTNPIGPESTYVVPGEDPPMANPPPGPKNDAGEALPGPSRPLLRLAKVTQKRGFCRRFSDGFPTVFSASSPTVSGRFCPGSPAVSRRFAGDAVPLDQPRSGSGVPLHPKETVGQFRTHFQAYKPSIWEEESFRRYMESREEALPAGTQRPWWKFWGTG